MAVRPKTGTAIATASRNAVNVRVRRRSMSSKRTEASMNPSRRAWWARAFLRARQQGGVADGSARICFTGPAGSDAWASCRRVARPRPDATGRPGGQASERNDVTRSTVRIERVHAATSDWRDRTGPAPTDGGVRNQGERTRRRVDVISSVALSPSGAGPRSSSAPPEAALRGDRNEGFLCGAAHIFCRL